MATYSFTTVLHTVDMFEVEHEFILGVELEAGPGKTYDRLLEASIVALETLGEYKGATPCGTYHTWEIEGTEFYLPSSSLPSTLSDYHRDHAYITVL